MPQRTVYPADRTIGLIPDKQRRSAIRLQARPRGRLPSARTRLRSARGRKGSCAEAPPHHRRPVRAAGLSTLTKSVGDRMLEQHACAPFERDGAVKDPPRSRSPFRASPASLAHRSRPPLPRALSRTAAVTQGRDNTNRNTRHRRQDAGGQGRDRDCPRGVTPNGTSEFVDHVRTGWTTGFSDVAVNNVRNTLQRGPKRDVRRSETCRVGARADGFGTRAGCSPGTHRSGDVHALFTIA
jgi:hypothetical protein